VGTPGGVGADVVVVVDANTPDVIVTTDKVTTARVSNIFLYKFSPLLLLIFISAFVIVSDWDGESFKRSQFQMRDTFRLTLNGGGVRL
jgi:hypothetical protein